MSRPLNDKEIVAYARVYEARKLVAHRREAVERARKLLGDAVGDLNNAAEALKAADEAWREIADAMIEGDREP